MDLTLEARYQFGKEKMRLLREIQLLKEFRSEQPNKE
jgi:hypothetical protein